MASLFRALPGAAVCLFVCALVVAADSPKTGDGNELNAKVDGFQASYGAVKTPKSDWEQEKDAEWVTRFRGSVATEKTIAYRGRELAPGSHDLWVEKGRGDWFYLYVGDRSDEEKPQLRAMFKLYEQEEGVEDLQFELKLTRRSSKLKFSLKAGRSEGHGNFRIVPASTKKDESAKPE